mgnify:CR=1 FL=1
MEKIAGQDGRRLSEGDINGWLAATAVGLINDIIMEQGRTVKIFKGDGQAMAIDNIIRPLTTSGYTATKHTEQRTKPLAAIKKTIVQDLGQSVIPVTGQ